MALFKTECSMSKISGSNYKWYILALSMLTYALIAGAQRMALPVLFKEISINLDLSLVSIGTIWGMDPLAGVFTALPGGLLADRFGVKRTLTVVCFLAGIFCALRGFSTSFLTMAAFMFLFGIIASVTPSIVPKTTAVWFSARQMDLTNALVNISWSVGSMAAALTSASYLSPLLGGWRNVLFVLGLPALVLGFLWLFTGREPRKHEVATDAVTQVPPLRQSLIKVAKMKEIWILGLLCMVMWGSNTGMFGYLPLYLRNIGWAPESADGAITALMGATTVGMIPMVLLANRFGIQKAMFFSTLVVLTASLALLPLVKDVWVWVVIVVSGLLRSSQPALTNVLVFKTKGVGSVYSGTAIGLVSSVGMVGGTFAPAVGNSLSDISPGGPFFFWAGFSALGLPLYLILWKMWNRSDSAARLPT